VLPHDSSGSSCIASDSGTHTTFVGTSIVPPRVRRVTVLTSRSVPRTGSGAASTSRIVRPTRIPGKTGLPDPMNASSSDAGFSCRNKSMLSSCCVRICMRRHRSCSGRAAVALHQLRLVLAVRARPDRRREPSRSSSVENGIEYAGSRHHGTNIGRYVSP
jgi:hypothetical protein